MNAAARRAVLALATLLAAATCDLSQTAGPGLTEGEPPLAVIPPPPPRQPVAVPHDQARALGKAAALVPLYAALEAIDTTGRGGAGRRHADWRQPQR